jgi:cold shock CspA family protein
MPAGKIKMFNEDKGFGDGDEISQGKPVSFEMGVDKKSGKTKAVSVDLV